MLDVTKMRRIAEDLYVDATQRCFGNPGVGALKDLLDRLVQIYRRADPGIRSSPLFVVVEVPGKSKVSLGAMATRISDVAHLKNELEGQCCALLSGRNALEIYPASGFDPIHVSQEAIVYSIDADEEKIYVMGEVYRINNPSSDHASIFARPTFTSLRTALESYRVRFARESSCEILKAIWHDANRLILANKPEATMRKSLNQFLANVLQDAEVRPEQNNDETHPVDVKVTWTLSDHRAIIEIKWLGDSIAEDGTLGTAYRDARAVSGAKQLAEYLDQSATWGAGVNTRGYLVVFDARRRGLTLTVATIDAANGLHYESREITYPVDYPSIRKDYDEPTRFFMRPICS